MLTALLIMLGVVALVATNASGSVNGKTFVVGGILEGITGPGGCDG